MVDDGVYDRVAFVNCLWNVACNRYNYFARRLRVGRSGVTTFLSEAFNF